SGVSTVAAFLAVALLIGAAPVERRLSAGAIEQPALAFPTGIAGASDGAISIASTYTANLIRFVPPTAQPREPPPPKHAPTARLLSDSAGGAWFAASGLAFVGRQDPGGGTPKEFAIPSILIATAAFPAPWAITRSPTDGELWFSVHSSGIVGRLARGAEPVHRGFAVREIKVGPGELRLDGIAADARGGVWVAEPGGDQLARIPR